MTVEEWSKIAADKDNPIFTIVDELSESSEIKNETEYCETNAAHFALSLIGFSTQLEDLNEWMYPERFFSKLKIISFIGMAGIGKTTFVTNIFKEDATLSRFDYNVWIHIGPRYQTKEILIDILAQIYCRDDEVAVKMEVKDGESGVKMEAAGA